MTALFNGLAFMPRHLGILYVLIITRISTIHQDEKSLDDQAELCKKFILQHYDGAVEFRIIADQNSGELLDRAKLIEAEDAVASRKYDVVISEDLGRVCRRNRAIDFCEMCEDSSSRLISINDSIDTARNDWRMNAFFASIKHESYNKDTAARIRRTLRNRFINGGVNQTYPFGYVKPIGAQSDADVFKDPLADKYIFGMIEMLERGCSYEEVADWFHAEGVPLGQWTRSKRWTARMIARLVHNPLLKGFRRRNEKMSKRVNKSGRRQSIAAPKSDLLLRPVPHLAYAEPERIDRLIAKLAVKNAWCARVKNGEPDPRAGVAKKKTVWPSQHAVCGVCGFDLNLSSFKKERRLGCSGVRFRACWCSISACGNQAGPKIAAAVLAAIKTLPDFDPVMIAQIESEAAASNAVRQEVIERIDRELAVATRKCSNLGDALADTPRSETLRQKLAEAESLRQRLEVEKAELLSKPSETIVIPTRDEIVQLVTAALDGLDYGDPAFSRRLSILVPVIETFPVRLLIGGGIYLRARCKIRLMSLIGESTGLDAESFEVTSWVDLFEPLKWLQLLPEIVAKTAAGMNQRDIAKDLSTHQVTVHQATVQRAMELHRLMRDRNTTDPYEFVKESPSEGKSFKRHLKPRYEFRPKQGYPAWPDAA